MKKILLATVLASTLSTAAMAQTYTIRYGDTLLDIANRHGVTYSELMKANRGLDPDYIKAGFKIKIPEASRSKQVQEERYVHPASKRSKSKTPTYSSFTNPERPSNESLFYTPTGRTKVVVTEY